MDMPSPFRVPATPGTPLYALSPERINQQRIPPSPSLPHNLFNGGEPKHHRSSSDVQSKVAFINSLSQANINSRQQSSANHAAVQRAILGREEAEAALSVNSAQLAESQLREQKVCERMELLLEELQTAKERQAHERQVFEKEIRRARKEAFRAGSALVKAQEDVKDARAEARSLKSEVQHERSEKEKSRQEAFERAYTIAGMMEQIEEMRERMQHAEAERDALVSEQQTKEKQNEEAWVIRNIVNRCDMAIQTDPEVVKKEEADPFLEATPTIQKEKPSHNHSPYAGSRENRFEQLLPTDSPEMTPLLTWGVPFKSRRESHMGRSESEEYQEDNEGKFLDLRGELRWEKRLRERAEDMVHFLQMECQFKTCACRVAEKKGERFVHDWEYEHQIQLASTEGKLTGEEKAEQRFVQQSDIQQVSIATEEGDLELFTPPPLNESGAMLEDDLLILSSPQRPSSSYLSQEDMTYQSPIRCVPRSPSPSSTPVGNPPADLSISGFAASPKSPREGSPSASPYPMTPIFKTPARPQMHTVHSYTTTTMVPLRDLDKEDFLFPAPGTPGTPISREAALEQIRARRDRARSVVLNPLKSTPGSARRGVAGGVRDISAPGRF